MEQAEGGKHVVRWIKVNKATTITPWRSTGTAAPFSRHAPVSHSPTTTWARASATNQRLPYFGLVPANQHRLLPIASGYDCQWQSLTRAFWLCMLQTFDLKLYNVFVSVSAHMQMLVLLMPLFALLWCVTAIITIISFVLRENMHLTSVAPRFLHVCCNCQL